MLEIKQALVLVLLQFLEELVQGPKMNVVAAQARASTQPSPVVVTVVNLGGPVVLRGTLRGRGKRTMAFSSQSLSQLPHIPGPGP